MRVRAEPFAPGQVAPVLAHVRGLGDGKPLSDEALRRIDKRLKSQAARELVEHYSVGGEVPLYWCGEGAKLLGLEGIVAEEELESVMVHARSPRGELLRGRRLEEHTVTMWGLVLGQPKSVSLLLAEGYDTGVADLLHQYGVARFLHHLENLAVESRISLKANQSAKRLGLLCARATHHVSSEADPHVHEHILLANSVPYQITTTHEDGAATSKVVWRTIFGLKFRSWKFIAAEAATQDMNRMVEYLLGTNVVTGEGELRHLVDPALLVTFSHAREKLLNERSDAKPTAKEDRYLWRAQRRDGASGAIERGFDAAWYDPSGVGRRRVVAYWRDAIGGFTIAGNPVLPIIDHLASVLFDKIDQLRNVVRRPEVLDPLYGPRWPTSPEETEHVLEEIERHLARLITFPREAAIQMAVRALGGYSDEVVRFVDDVVIPERLCQIRTGGYTTIGLLRSDVQTRRMVKALAASIEEPTLGQLECGMKLLTTHPEWDSQQRNAFGLAVSSGKGIVAWQGVAGAGKSVLVEAVRIVDEAAGRPIRGVAVGGSAAWRLHESSGVESVTVAKMVMLLRQGRKLPGRVRLVIDEVSQISAKDLDVLVHGVRAAHGSILAIGDLRQSQAIDMRGIATLLFEEARAQECFAELSTSYRARSDQVRRLGAAVRKMDVASVLDVVGEGNDVECHNASELTDAVRRIAERVAEDHANGMTSIGLAFSRRDAARISTEVQRIVFADDDTERQKVTIGDQTRQVAMVGDLIRNRKPGEVDGTHLLNGDLFTVNAVAPDGRLRAYSHRLERDVVFPKEATSSLELGYASTIDSAQGGSWDAAHILLTGSEGATRLYSAVTRARDSVSLELIASSLEETLSEVLSRDDQQIALSLLVDERVRMEQERQIAEASVISGMFDPYGTTGSLGTQIQQPFIEWS